MPRQLSCDDLVHSGLLNGVGDSLAQFSVGFVKLVERSGMEDMVFAGSGTLVKTQTRFGILTADHVLQNLPRDEIGLVFPNRNGGSPHRYLLRIDEAQKMRIGPASNDAEGPDIGVLLLHRSDAAKLEVNSAFYNLEKRREQMLATPRSIEAGGWFLRGAADEWTTDGPPVRAFTKVKVFCGFCAAGVVSAKRADSKFDYLSFDIAINDAYEGPSDYRGTSGGGLWQLVFEDNDGEIRIAEQLLSGVAFYQIAKDGKPQTIVCHGRRSIYAKVLGMLQANAS